MGWRCPLSQDPGLPGLARPTHRTVAAAAALPCFAERDREAPAISALNVLASPHSHRPIRDAQPPGITASEPSVGRLRCPCFDAGHHRCHSRRVNDTARRLAHLLMPIPPSTTLLRSLLTTVVHCRYSLEVAFSIYRTQRYCVCLLSRYWCTVIHLWCCVDCARLYSWPPQKWVVFRGHSRYISCVNRIWRSRHRSIRVSTAVPLAGDGMRTWGSLDVGCSTRHLLEHQYTAVRSVACTSRPKRLPCRCDWVVPQDGRSTTWPGAARCSECAASAEHHWQHAVAAVHRWLARPNSLTKWTLRIPGAETPTHRNA